MKIIQYKKQEFKDCENCRRPFRRGEDSKDKVCPYCLKQAAILENEKETSQELTKDEKLCILAGVNHPAELGEI